MRIRDIISVIEDFAPLALQESWDNSGLQCGDASADCTGVMLCMDVTPDVIEEAFRKGCNLVVSHHPMIFRGIKRVTGATVAERCLLAAIRLGVAVYSSHTALDSAEGGVSYALAAALGVRVRRVLKPAGTALLRLTVYAPREAADDVRAALADSLASDAAIVATDARALGSRMTEDADGLPVLDITHRPLTSFSLVMSSLDRAEAEAMLSGFGHGISYSFERLEQNDARVGLGVVGDLPRALTADEFVAAVKAATGASVLRCSRVADGAEIRRVAVCGGAGGEFIADAVRAGADAYVTADIRYHDFGEWGGSIMLADAGHFETESCTKSIFMQLIKEKFANFAVYIAESEKNPINYL